MLCLDDDISGLFLALLLGEPFINTIDVDGVVFVSGIGESIGAFGIVDGNNVWFIINPTEDGAARGPSPHIAVVNQDFIRLFACDATALMQSGGQSRASGEFGVFFGIGEVVGIPGEGEFAGVLDQEGGGNGFPADRAVGFAQGAIELDHGPVIRVRDHVRITKISARNDFNDLCPIVVGL